MDEILLIDKPKGITSFDVIRKLKIKYPRGTKIGHAGTLDPNATGLMIVGVGNGTKQLKEYLGLNKTYEAEILLGTKTDSGDITGKVIDKKLIGQITEQEVKCVLDSLVGRLRLPVSKYSAKKIGGKRSYELARSDKPIPEILQDMDLLDVEFGGLFKVESEYIVMAKLEVSSGTYIRSIAEELGRRLALPATLRNLRRLRIGDFKIEDAIKI